MENKNITKHSVNGNDFLVNNQGRFTDEEIMGSLSSVDVATIGDGCLAFYDGYLNRIYMLIDKGIGGYKVLIYANELE